MKKVLSKRTTWFAVIALCAILTSAAWASHKKLLLPFPGQPLFRNQPASNDTVPKKSKQATTRNKKERSGDYDGDLDKAVEDLERAIMNLKLALKNKNWEKYKDLWKENDFDLLSKKAMRDLESNMAMEEFRRAQEESIREFDMQKLQKELEQSQLNMQKDFEKMHWDFDHLGDEWEKAQLHMEHADIEMRNLESFINELKKNELIKKGKEYEIKIDHGELYIDGKKQPPGVTDKYKNNEKYKKLFDEDSNFNLKSDGNDDDEWL